MGATVFVARLIALGEASPGCASSRLSRPRQNREYLMRLASATRTRLLTEHFRRVCRLGDRTKTRRIVREFNASVQSFVLVFPAGFAVILWRVDFNPVSRLFAMAGDMMIQEKPTHQMFPIQG